MKEKYIKQIIKLLTCSKKRREEIKKQLSADIDGAIDAGESFETVQIRMGEPKEIADGFNQSFSDGEKKAFRRERRRRRILDIVIVILILIPVFWWMIPKNTLLKDSNVFDVDTVQAKAEEVVSLLDESDYDALKEIADDKMAELLNAKEMNQAKSHFGEDWGEFQNFGSPYLIESTQRGQHTAVVQINASYENTSVTYTISFNEDMKLNGLWMK